MTLLLNKIIVKKLETRFSRNHVFQIWETFFSKSTEPISVNQNFFDTLFKQLVKKPLKS